MPTTQAIRCRVCAYVACRCPKLEDVEDVIDQTGDDDAAFLETFRKAMDENPGVPRPVVTGALKAAVQAVQQPQDMRPLLDDILDATQAHLSSFVQAMPASVQAKRETQKRLPLLVPATKAPAVRPGGKRSLSELAALL